MKNLLLIDGNSILNRAFYGIMNNKILTTKDGTPTNAVYGFLAIMFKILEEVNPEYIAVAFDLKAKTKRHKLYPEYKGTRKGMPDELAIQMPIIKEILSAMNILIMEKEGYEADDILGTVAKFAVKQEVNVIILTGDRDYFQLAEDNITIRIPRTKQGKTETEDFNRSKVIEVYGLEPEKLIEVKGLMGDASDNIPGILGVGEKTAINLIKEYGSIKNIYKSLKNKKKKNNNIKGRLRERILENEDLAFLSRTLGEIDIHADIIELDMANFLKKEWNNIEVYELFKTLSFNRFIERFDLQQFSNNKDFNINIEVVENTSEKSLLELLKCIEKKKRMFFYVDIIDNNDIKLILKKEINGIYIYNEDDNKAYFINKNYFLKDFKNLLESNEILKIGYRLKEVYIILRQANILSKNMMFDISVAAYILNSTQSNYNIERLIDEYLEFNLDAYNNNKSNLNEHTQLNLFEVQELQNASKFSKIFGVYAFLIYKLYNILIEKLQKTEQLDLFNNIEMPLLEVLAEMQINGIYIDKHELKKIGNDLREKIDKLVYEIYELAECEFNISSPKQLGEILFEKLKLPVQKKTKSGFSTDMEVLEKLKEHHPIIEKVLEYRQLMKLNSTYVEGLLKDINPVTNRIHSTFHQTVTATGRISSADPNLQNIPTRVELGKQLRKAFKANEDCIFIDSDYSQIELRVLAHISNDKNMLDAFANDEDIHKQVASKVFNIPYDQVTKEERGYAKAVNFGIVYGISDFGLSEQLHIPRKEAKEYIEQYLKKYKGIKNFMDNIVKFAIDKGYVETLFKRKRYIEEIKSKNYNIRQFGHRVAMNTPIQGTAADIMKIAMINVYNKLKENNLKSKLILQVHDEIIVETYIEEKEIVKKIIKDSMENAIKLNVELKIEIEEGKDWYTAK